MGDKGKGIDSLRLHYLDYNATSPMAPGLVRRLAALQNFGNPSSSFASASAMRVALETVRPKLVAPPLFEGGGRPESWEVTFTSGATESVVTVIRAVTEAARRKNGALVPVVLASGIEHACVLETLAAPPTPDAWRHSTIRPERDGTVSPERVAAELVKRKGQVVLVAVMLANNETGAINDVNGIGKVCQAEGIPLLVDATQGYGKVPVPAKFVGFVTASFHKLYGPAGVGLLAARGATTKRLGLEPLLPGTQNGGRRGGTENAPGILVGAEAALAAGAKMSSEARRLFGLRRRLLAGLAARFPIHRWVDGKPKGPGLLVFGPKEPDRQLPGTVLLSVYVPGARPRFCNTTLKKELETEAGVIVSLGAACKTTVGKGSHVVAAMGGDDDVLCGVVRVSMGARTKAADVDAFLRAFETAVRRQLPDNQPHSLLLR